MKKNKTIAESAFKKAQDDNKPLEKRLKELEAGIRSCSESEQLCKRQLNDKQKELSRQRETLNNLEDEVDRPREELENKKKQERQRLGKVTRTRTEIEEMEHQLESFISEDDVKAQVAEKTRELREIGMRLQEIQEEQQHIAELKQGHMEQRNSKCAVLVCSICNKLPQNLRP